MASKAQGNWEDRKEESLMPCPAAATTSGVGSQGYLQKQSLSGKTASMCAPACLSACVCRAACASLERKAAMRSDYLKFL